MGKIKSFLFGAALVPLGGLLAHIGASAFEADPHADYSLKHRFESAYCFNTPDDHKQYTVTEYVSGYAQESYKTKYLASPWLTYPAMLGLGVLSARRRWDKKLKDKIRGNSGR